MVKVKMGTISNNFSYVEFEESNTAKERHITNVINSFSIRDSIKALVLTVLQPLRDKIGTAMHVDSGYRCPDLNKAIGGVPGSQHVLGEAADIASSDPYSLAKAAYDLKLPYDQMILYPTFVHFSHKLNGQQRNQICYNYRYKGQRL